jgi:hypothetical protein
MPRPERIVLVRSGRHLQTAIDTLKRAYPGCHVSVIATPGAERARIEAGIAEADWMVCLAPRFDAWPMLHTGTAPQVWARRFDRVAVLWQDREGSDRANVDRAAFALSPSGFVAITPDGALIHKRSAAIAGRELSMALVSSATLAVMTLTLYLPAAIAGLFRRQRPAQ